MENIIMNQENFTQLVEFTMFLGFLFLVIFIPGIIAACQFIKQYKEMRMKLILANLIEPETPIEKVEWQHNVEMKRWQTGK